MEITRRSFIKLGALFGIGLAVPGMEPATQSDAGTEADADFEFPLWFEPETDRGSFRCLLPVIRYD